MAPPPIVATRRYSTTLPSGCVGMTALKVPPFAVIATAVSLPPATRHTSATLPSTGAAQVPMAVTAIAIVLPSRVGRPMPNVLEPSTRPWGPNAASIRHWLGVPLARLPSSSSAASTSGYVVGMSSARRSVA